MNPKKKYYGDSRLTDFCAYCGGLADTEDHVPCRCFLNEPYPQNMPVVPCCLKCNHEFSEDEEYVSCLIDCMKYNTVVPDEIPREKTRRTLLHSPKLQERIALQKREFGGVIVYDIEKERVKKVIRKLAYGHLAFENDTMIHYLGISILISQCGCCLKCPIHRRRLFSMHMKDLCCQKYLATDWNILCCILKIMMSNLSQVHGLPFKRGDTHIVFLLIATGLSL